MAVISPYEIVAAQLKSIIDTEFAPEGVSTLHDRIHESLGHNRITVGISPMRDVPMARQLVAQETWVEIRFWGLYDRQINPDQIADPRLIANWAERLRRAIQAGAYPYAGTTQVWFYNVMETRYPDDPTGNATRFIMTVCAHGQNAGVVETTG